MDHDVSRYNPVAEAYHILLNALDKEQTDMDELAAAMREAIGYLGEALE